MKKDEYLKEWDEHNAHQNRIVCALMVVDALEPLSADMPPPDIHKVKLITKYVYTLPVYPESRSKLWELAKGNSNLQRKIDYGDKVYDCDNWARELQDYALSQGYLLNVEILTTTEAKSLFGYKSPKTPHAVNTAIIDNTIYYIDVLTIVRGGTVD